MFPISWQGASRKYGCYALKEMRTFGPQDILTDTSPTNHPQEPYLTGTLVFCCELYLFLLLIIIITTIISHHYFSSLLLDVLRIIIHQKLLLFATSCMIYKCRAVSYYTKSRNLVDFTLVVNCSY